MSHCPFGDPRIHGLPARSRRMPPPRRCDRSAGHRRRSCRSGRQPPTPRVARRTPVRRTNSRPGSQISTPGTNRAVMIGLTWTPSVRGQVRETGILASHPTGTSAGLHLCLKVSDKGHRADPDGPALGESIGSSECVDEEHVRRESRPGSSSSSRPSTCRRGARSP